MKVSAIIPARYCSKRLPGKPLIKIHGKSMIRWVHEALSTCSNLDSVIIATDDKRIFDECTRFGAQVVMTRADHKSGTDRIAEVAKTLDSDLILNVQGDEPLINSHMIETLINLMKLKVNMQMGSLARLLTAQELESSNLVKVWVHDWKAIDFFRRLEISEKNKQLLNSSLFAHIGIYCYRRDFLLKYSALKESMREQETNLEQLRAIENGYDIIIGLVDYNGIGVDTLEDVEKVELILEKMK